MNQYTRSEHPFYLSDKEFEAAKLLCQDKTLSEAGQVMGLSPKTVSTYKYRVMKKLQVRSVLGMYKKLNTEAGNEIRALQRFCPLCSAALERMR